eukprot:Awhi_evm2s15289
MSLLLKLLVSSTFILAYSSDLNNGELCPEINKGHPHRVKRSATSSSFTVGYKENVSLTDKSEFESEFQEFIRKSLPIFNLIFFEIPDSLEQDVIFDIRSRSVVRMVEHVVMRHEAKREKSLHWNLDSLVHESNRKMIDGAGYGVTIYVVDSGIDDHAEFGSRIDRKRSKSFRSQKDANGDTTDSFDCRGHGTAVAGAAAGKNSGVARSASIVSYAVTECQSGSIDPQNILDALHHLIENYPASKVVINLSNGVNAISDTDPSLMIAEEQLSNKGAVIIRAAGNLGKDSCQYGQLGLDFSLSVASSDSSNGFVSSSNYGSCVDIIAPGQDILLPMHDDQGLGGKGLGFFSGTSFAAPQVAGAAAVFMSKYNIIGLEVATILLSHALPIITNAPENTINSLLQLPVRASLPLQQTQLLLYENVEYLSTFNYTSVLVDGVNKSSHTGKPYECIKACLKEYNCYGFAYACAGGVGSRCQEDDVGGTCDFLSRDNTHPQRYQWEQSEDVGINCYFRSKYRYWSVDANYVPLESPDNAASLDCPEISRLNNIDLEECLFWAYSIRSEIKDAIEYNNHTKTCIYMNCDLHFSLLYTDQDEKSKDRSDAYPGSAVFYHHPRAVPIAMSGYFLGTHIEEYFKTTIVQNHYDSEDATDRNRAYSCPSGSIQILKQL